jgi:hypothetical protein
MRRSLIAALMFLLPMVAVAQTASQQANDSTCTAAMARSLTIRGIRLGMSTDELLALFPGASERADVKAIIEQSQQPPNFGAAGFGLGPGNSATKDRLEGVSWISITLFDDRVVGYAIQYTGWPTGPTWMKVDDWIAKLSETLGLPGPRDWDQGSQTERLLACEGLELRANTINGGTLSVLSKEHIKIQAERVKAYQEKKQREFKP